ncbi:MAG: hypothetical protein JXQ30_14625 [Spirochaetes bacterium]|nr:hypothetical protein [Spirochaetota bacterium]
MDFSGSKKRYPLLVLLWILAFGLLYLLSLYQYLLFHTAAELFSIVIAGCIFILSWNSRRFFENGYFHVLGAAYLF